MNRNTEIKARIGDMDSFRALVESLADGEGQVLIQEDVFFACKTGRLKLRIFPDGQGELIAYQRPDHAGPKQSSYVIARTSEPDTLREALTSALGVLGIVSKTRLLYKIGQTRVHLDTVEDLGDFLELEVVLRPDQTEKDGLAIANRLIDLLHLRKDDLISGAYIDLLTGHHTPSSIQ